MLAAIAGVLGFLGIKPDSIKIALLKLVKRAKGTISKMAAKKESWNIVVHVEDEEFTRKVDASLIENPYPVMGGGSSLFHKPSGH